MTKQEVINVILDHKNKIDYYVPQCEAKEAIEDEIESIENLFYISAKKNNHAIDEIVSLFKDWQYLLHSINNDDIVDIFQIVMEEYVETHTEYNIPEQWYITINRTEMYET